MDSTYGLDPGRQCTHRNEQGRCGSRSMAGETRCPAHSDSAAAASLRERMVVRETREELNRAGAQSAQGLTYNPPPLRAVENWGERGARAGAPSRTTEGRRSAAADEVHKMLFRGDITTGEGLIRMSERLVREFAAGKLEPRRFEILMRAVRLMAALRRQFPAPPIDEPAEQNEPALADETLVVEADRRPAADRAEALKQDYRRPPSCPSVVREGTVSAEPEPAMRQSEPVRVGDYKVKRRGEPSRRRGFSASSRGESRDSRYPSARRLRFTLPQRSKNRDVD